MAGHGWPGCPAPLPANGFLQACRQACSAHPMPCHCRLAQVLCGPGQRQPEGRRHGHDSEGAKGGAGRVQVRAEGPEKSALYYQGIRQRCQCRPQTSAPSSCFLGCRPPAGPTHTTHPRLPCYCRSGAFNCLVATCIGEEGLDIPQVWAHRAANAGWMGRRMGVRARLITRLLLCGAPRCCCKAALHP